MGPCGWQWLLGARSLALALVVAALAAFTEAGPARAPHPQPSRTFAQVRDGSIPVALLDLGGGLGVQGRRRGRLDTYGLALESMATLGIGIFFFALMIGRLLGSAVLHWMPAKAFFVATSASACVSLLGLFLGVRPIAIASILMIGLAFGNIFPLMFSILIDAMATKSNELSGLTCMAIVGGAVMPLTMGLIADHSVMASFLVPLGSLGFILATALASRLRAEPVLSP